jgi:hypothetical protein
MDMHATIKYIVENIVFYAVCAEATKRGQMRRVSHTGPETKNDFAGKDQQQFTDWSLSWLGSWSNGLAARQWPA